MDMETSLAVGAEDGAASGVVFTTPYARILLAPRTARAADGHRRCRSARSRAAVAGDAADGADARRRPRLVHQVAGWPSDEESTRPHDVLDEVGGDERAGGVLGAI